MKDKELICIECFSDFLEIIDKNNIVGLDLKFEK